ncbi:hypothetical protein [Paraburkholderia strydomiana]|uniref:hypothetical protein n=1 Tax=Paraburkholderia strydomiana TaxID=1245417 RepID=UPI0038B8A529
MYADLGEIPLTQLAGPSPTEFGGPTFLATRVTIGPGELADTASYFRLSLTDSNGNQIQIRRRSAPEVFLPITAVWIPAEKESGTVTVWMRGQVDQSYFAGLSWELTDTVPETGLKSNDGIFSIIGAAHNLVSGTLAVDVLYPPRYPHAETDWPGDNFLATTHIPGFSDTLARINFPVSLNNPLPQGTLPDSNDHPDEPFPNDCPGKPGCVPQPDLHKHAELGSGDK